MHNYSQVLQYDMWNSPCHDETCHHCHDITIKILICDTLEIIIISDTVTESMIENGCPYISIASGRVQISINTCIYR